MCMWEKCQKRILNLCRYHVGGCQKLIAGRYHHPLMNFEWSPFCRWWDVRWLVTTPARISSLALSSTKDCRSRSVSRCNKRRRFGHMRCEWREEYVMAPGMRCKAALHDAKLHLCGAKPANSTEPKHYCDHRAHHISGAVLDIIKSRVRNAVHELVFLTGSEQQLASTEDIFRRYSQKPDFSALGQVNPNQWSPILWTHLFWSMLCHRDHGLHVPDTISELRLFSVLNYLGFFSSGSLVAIPYCQVFQLVVLTRSCSLPSFVSD